MTVQEQKTWWQGNSTRFWRMLVLLLWGIIVFFGQREIQRVDIIQARQAEIRSGYAERTEITQMYDRMDAGFDNLNKKIDEINRYLRDQRKSVN